MSLQGEIRDGDWAIDVSTSARADGQHDCRIRVSQRCGEGSFDRQFLHDRIFPTAREAMLEGLREGMIWIELKKLHAFAG
jgi:predicted RNA binding protein with dsRBD fold (UPF0201 family)